MGVNHLVERIWSERPGLSPAQRRITVLVAVVGPILISECLLLFGAYGGALWGYLLTFVFFTLAPMRIRDSETGDVFRAFTLIPLFRLLTLGLPIFIATTLSWLPLVYGPMLLATYILQADLPAVDLPTFRDVGMTITVLPIVIIASAVLAQIEYAVLEPAPIVESLDLGRFVVVVFVMVVFVGFAEEFVFRGILQRTIAAFAGRTPGILLSSLVFGAMHAGLQNTGDIAFGVGIGVLFALLYDWTNNLILIALIHGVLNVFLFAVFPLHGTIYAL